MYHFALLFKRNSLIYYIYTILIGRNQRLLSILSDPYQKRFTPLFAPYHPRIEVPSTEFGTELVRTGYFPSPALISFIPLSVCLLINSFVSRFICVFGIDPYPQVIDKLFKELILFTAKAA